MLFVYTVQPFDISRILGKNDNRYLNLKLRNSHKYTHKQYYFLAIDNSSSVSSGGLRELEHPPKVWLNSQLSSCVITIVTAKTNNKLIKLALNGSFSSLLGLLCHLAVFKNTLMKGVINVWGHG